jgi:hypothetical protein
MIAFLPGSEFLAPTTVDDNAVVGFQAKPKITDTRLDRSIPLPKVSLNRVVVEKAAR